MSNKKTISINPKLFNLSKNKTQKNKPKKQEKVNIVPPNLFKSKILKRIQKHKQQEIRTNAKLNRNNAMSKNKNNNDSNKNNKNNKNNNDNNNNNNNTEDEFTSSMNYLNDVAKNHKKKQRNQKAKTFKNSEKTNMNVNIELPEELEEIKSNNIVLNDVPYGVLKRGNKPTYREYYNKTLKNRHTYSNTSTASASASVTAPNYNPIDINIDDNFNDDDDDNNIVFDDFNDEKVDIDLDTDMNLDIIKTPNPLPIVPVIKNTSISKSQHPIPSTKTTSSLPPKSVLPPKFSLPPKSVLPPKSPLPKKLNKITKKTVKKKYTLGKNKIKRKVGVLIKNNKTQKKIINAYKDLKKTSIKEIKDYLHKHNLIKIGSNIPLDVGRQMYEAAKLTGNIVNINSNNILHNLENAND